jgi:ubiquinone/menaquinone biosynthesis C-methylase UbiE
VRQTPKESEAIAFWHSVIPGERARPRSCAAKWRRLGDWARRCGECEKDGDTTVCSALGSIDDPALAKALAQVAMSPEWRVLRWRLVRRALCLARRGDAVSRGERSRTGQAVDLGCGTGHLAIELARQEPSLSIVGLDLSDEMVSLARSYVRRSGVGDRVSFIRGDAHSVPFADGSLDLVVSSMSLHHWRDPLAVLDEIARVLCPGGGFLVYDVRRDVSVPARLFLWCITHFFVPRALRRANEPLSSYAAGYTPQEAAQLARHSRLRGWHVASGALWLTIEGTM